RAVVLHMLDASLAEGSRAAADRAAGAWSLCKSAAAVYPTAQRADTTATFLASQRQLRREQHPRARDAVARQNATTQFQPLRVAQLLIDAHRQELRLPSQRLSRSARRRSCGREAGFARR